MLNHAKLPNIRLHDLRHTCATFLLSKGVHPKFVQELLGTALAQNWSSMRLRGYSSVFNARI